jgi:hypothetical protein
VDKVEEALCTFLGSSELIGCLARVLAYACKTGRTSYSEVEAVAGASAEDVLLVSRQWRLLLPIESIRGTMEWADRLFLAEPGEMYEMPQVVRFLVEGASQTGEWDGHVALTELFREMGEPDWYRMSALVKKLIDKSRDRRISAVQIKEACDQLGLGEKVDPVIAELKGGGVISPKVSSLFEVVKAGSPLYELNPSLLIVGREKN